jgi:hypothetical protein
MEKNCRHIKPSGNQCDAYAIRGEPFCYFHTRQRAARNKPATVPDSIEIPFLEDRCAIQTTITQVLRAIVNNTIERPRAALLLYGLQLALQAVDRKPLAIGFRTVQDISQTENGEELVYDPDDEEDEDRDDLENGEEEDGEEESDADDDEAEDDSGDGESTSPEEDEDSDADEEEDEEAPLAGPTTRQLMADRKPLQSFQRALDSGDLRLAARLLASDG